MAAASSQLIFSHLFFTKSQLYISSNSCLCCHLFQLKAGETAAVIARDLAEQTKSNLLAGDITYTVKAMGQLVDLLDVQLRNLTPGGKDSAARSLNKVERKVNGTISAYIRTALLCSYALPFI